MWPFTRKKENLPGVKGNPDSSMDSSITDEEQQAIDAFFKPLEGYVFHPEIADMMPKAGTACALCRYAIDLVTPLTRIDDEAEYNQRREEIMNRLNKALAATYKATSLYNLPEFTRHLASFSEMAGRTAEGERLSKLFSEQQAMWKPNQLDKLLLKWLEY
jgi:hypothetical protein